jgi:hypothetical protein
MNCPGNLPCESGWAGAERLVFGWNLLSRLERIGIIEIVTCGDPLFKVRSGDALALPSPYGREPLLHWVKSKRRLEAALPFSKGRRTFMQEPRSGETPLLRGEFRYLSC